MYKMRRAVVYPPVSTTSLVKSVVGPTEQPQCDSSKTMYVENEQCPVRAMSTAQSTPYRVNKQVLQVLREAVSTRLGILGLP